LHVALLFGFPKGPLVVTPKQVPVIEKGHEMPVVDWAEPPMPADPTEATYEKVSALKGEDLPKIDEIITDNPTSDFRVEIEPTTPTKTKLETKIIGPAGTPDGLPDGRGIHVQFFEPVTHLDKVPRATVRMSPAYPTALRSDGIEGVVMVEFDVDVKGRVVSARVRESTHRAFEEPTIRAVLQWRFEPGRSQGRAVPFRMVIPVNFTLGTG
jgi:protein TonB